MADNNLLLDLTDEVLQQTISRREFIKRTALTTGGIVIFFTLGDTLAFAQRREPNMPTDFNAYLRIGEDGRVTCYTGKIEMGQGIVTTLAQMLAEELDVPVESVDMVMGDTDLCPFDGGTHGSMSVRGFGPPLRAAGADARAVLLELAEEQLKVSKENLTVKNGVVSVKNNPKKKVTYAQLAKGKKITRQSQNKAPLKKPAEFTVIGKAINRLDGKKKVTGAAQYAGDIQLPGMVYARILRPPAHGAKLKTVDASAAEKINGVQVIRDGDLVAVLHAKPDVAEEALTKVKATYDPSPSTLDDKNIFDHLLSVAPQAQTLDDGGDIQSAEKEAVTVVEETYLNSYVAHAPMEPHTAVAKMEGNKVTIWVSSQSPFILKSTAAYALKIPQENVHVITTFVGGGFGGKNQNSQGVEAARLAKLSGKPVQVAWSREEEFKNDSFRPAAIVKIKSGITSSGKLALWDYHVYYAGSRGANQFYDIPNHRTVAYGEAWGGAHGAHPFETGAWRAPGNNTNTFARESQIDIMAVKAGMDPLEFRLKNLSNASMIRVLKTAADKFGWKPSNGKKPYSGRGYGIACGMDAGAYVAAIAEIVLNKTTGEVQVKRVVCAQDMGLVINPEGAISQMEGSITMGLGYTLMEEVHFKNGEILDRNFDTYSIPRCSWQPKIESVLIENNDAPAQGGGEPAIITVGGSVANAIYDAAGIRMLQLPMTPDRIKEALKNIKA